MALQQRPAHVCDLHTPSHPLHRLCQALLASTLADLSFCREVEWRGSALAVVLREHASGNRQGAQ